MIRVFACSLLALAACSSDEPKKTPTPSSAAVADAGTFVGEPAVLDAGAPPAADAGLPRDAGIPAATATTDAGTNATAMAASDTPARPAAQKSAFDRVLAKPKESGASADELKQKVERATGQKVLSVKKSARTWLLFEFAPAAPARTAATQQKLIDDMKDTGLFASIEGDRMLQVK